MSDLPGLDTPVDLDLTGTIVVHPLMAHDLAHALAHATGLPLHKAVEGVAAIFREIVLITNQGDPVRIAKFGTFRAVSRKERRLPSHLPHLAGKVVTVPGRRCLIFRAIRVRDRNRPPPE